MTAPGCRTAALVLMGLAACGHAFENAAMRKRNRGMREATSFINVPGYSEAEVRCAACEAIASTLEKEMSTDKHKGGTVDRLNMLVSTCDRIDRKLPAELPLPLGDADDPNAPKVLHFFESKAHEQVNQGVGLSEFCTVFIEEYEDELDAVMSKAEPIFDDTTFNRLSMSHGSMSHGGGVSKYNLHESVCLEATKSCTQVEC